METAFSPDFCRDEQRIRLSNLHISSLFLAHSGSTSEHLFRSCDCHFVRVMDMFLVQSTWQLQRKELM